MCDLLVATKQCGQEGIRPTTLLSRSNLSHGRMMTFILRLTDSGLVNQIKFDGKNTFVITPKGQLFLEEYRRFSDMAEAYGLEM
jgi:predicted transcriptional regulator